MGAILNIFLHGLKTTLLLPVGLAICSCSGTQDSDRLDLNEEVQVALNETEALNKTTGSEIIEVDDFNLALKAAVDAAPTVQSLKQAERALSSQLLALESQTKPQITSNARAGVIRYDNTQAERVSGVALNVLLSQLIYDGGYVSSSIGSAEAQLRLAQARTLQEKNRVATEAAAAWFTLWEAQQSFLLLSDLQSEIITFQEQAERMSDVGLVDRSVLDSVERKLLTFEGKRSDAKSALRSAQMAYVRYFKMLPEEMKYPKLPDSYRKIGLDVTTKFVNPAMRIAALELIIEKQFVKVKKSEFSPQVFFEFGVTSPVNKSDEANLRGGLNVRYTITDGGKRAAELSAAEENVISKQYALNAARQEVGLLKKLLLERFDNAQNAEAMMRKSVLGAKERFMVAESQIQTGKSNIVELVEARYQYVISEIDLLAKTAEKERLQLELVELLGLYDS